MTRLLAISALLLTTSCANAGGSPASTRSDMPRASAPMTAQSSTAAVRVPALRESPAPRAARSRATDVPRRAAAKGKGTALRGARLNWTALARCESGGNPRAVSKSGKYRGLYQFDLRTWRSVGGVGDPIDASRAEQTRRAQLLYNARGRAPWPYCGRFL